ncbi:MAG TPA: MBL fold metallo-hydrolase [Gemmatimonadales bacterium]|nr:MBL fold metallo-hydrolase [Gemmatimonadales bacterium]
MNLRLGLIAAIGFAGLAEESAAQKRCDAAPLMLQVLGSGGPFASGNRASAGYLVWRDGKPIVMVDAGGGTYLRFAEAGAHLADLSLLAISHMHADHVADLTALMWQSDRLRKQPLRIAGPSGAGMFPAMDVFVRRLFDSTGAFPILGGTVGQRGGGVKLDVVTVDVTKAAATQVLEEGDLEVTALGVPHGDVPSVGYRVRVGDRTVVFGSDNAGTNPRFIEFASGADILVLHLSVSAAASDPLSLRHARPAVVGSVAAAIHPRRLVLSHLIEAPAPVETEQYSLSNLEKAVSEVKTSYKGLLDVATDLQCYPIGAQ